MNFGLTSIEFLFFLPIVVCIYYLFPAHIRKYFLLLVNLLFYASFGLHYLVYIILEALIAFLFGLSVKSKREHLSEFLFYPMVLLLGGLLIAFRVFSISEISIVAPLGISFYTLETLSYVIDVRKGKINCERNFFKLLSYLSFFPTITSGPILRYNKFSDDYENSGKNCSYEGIIRGIIYMLYGYFLKLVIAERAAIPVNSVFDGFESAEYSGIILLMVALTYSVQIFADFAGYSAIVIGIAQILGYDIPDNFIAPYFSKTIKEFWGRWHISLSTWLRDYIYIPLGGNRKGTSRKYFNIIITFVVSGLWHGFRVHYIIWGLLHGGYQIIDEMTQNLRAKIVSFLKIKKNSVFHKTVQCLITFMLVSFAWIFFRTGTKDALKYIIRIFTHPNFENGLRDSLSSLGLPTYGWIILIISVLFAVFADYILYSKGKRIDAFLNENGRFAKVIFVVIISLTILIFGIYGDQHDAGYFVYRDF